MAELASEMAQWELHQLRGLSMQLLGEVFSYAQLVTQSRDAGQAQAANALLARCQLQLALFEADRARALHDPELRRSRP